MQRTIRSVIIISACFFSFSLAMSEEMKDFRGIAWGASASTVPGLREIKSPIPNAKTYTRDGDEMSLGGAALEQISYSFYNDQLFYISLRSVGQSNIDALKKVAFEKFGRMSQPNEFLEEYIKTMKTTRAFFIAHPIQSIGSLSISYLPIEKQMEKDEKKRAKDGAAVGF